MNIKKLFFLIHIYLIFNVNYGLIYILFFFKLHFCRISMCYVFIYELLFYSIKMYYISNVNQKIILFYLFRITFTRYCSTISNCQTSKTPSKIDSPLKISQRYFFFVTYDIKFSLEFLI